MDEPPKLFVLAVGVNEYVEPTWHLRFAATDAKSVAKALQEVGSGIFGTNVKINIVTDQEATEQGIGAVFAQLAKEVKPRDVFILYLSGHGRAIAGSGWFFLPANLKLGPQSTIENKAIGQDKLQNWLGQIQALKSVIILDACEAGAAETLKAWTAREIPL